MSYLLNGLNQLAFTGQIASYIGVTDPSGWVIGDNTSRANTNGMYNNLRDMGIGTITNETYTPPDLRGYLLCGYDGTNQINTFAGQTANQLTLYVGQLPDHNHGTTATTTSNTNNSHTHTYDDSKYIDNSDDPKAEGGDGHGNRQADETTGAAVYTDHVVTIDTTGGTDSINVANKSYVINWIIKI